MPRQRLVVYLRCFQQRIKQRAGVRAFGRLERLTVIAIVGMLLVQKHQQIDIELVVML
jgi:hypothetical protein